MARDQTEPQEYVLVYDGESGLRMAPAGARGDDLPEPLMTLGGDRGPAPPGAGAAKPAPRRGRRGLILAGSAGACVLAVALGVGLASRQAAPSDPVEFGPRMKVVVAPERPAPLAPAVTASDRLDVLSPVTLAAAPPPALDVRPVAQTPRLALAPSAALPVAQGPAPSPREVAADMPTQAGGGLAAHCGAPRSRGEDMVCADPELLAADRRMARAFRAAARSGVDIQQLRDEQDDWLSIREDAAGRSPRAVAQIYDQRIDELEAMAAEASPDR